MQKHSRLKRLCVVKSNPAVTGSSPAAPAIPFPDYVHLNLAAASPLWAVRWTM
jgi:hypothetical protein